MNPKILIAVVGPTGIGKTKIAITVAKHFNVPVLSADSRQFYKEMRIGTAVPSEKELTQAIHHFIQHKSIHQPYSVGDYEKDAIALLNIWYQKREKMVLVGGSGLYVDAVVNGLDDFPKVDYRIREELMARYNIEGVESLQSELKALDPDYYTIVDLKNPYRIIRALEVCKASGKPYSTFRNQEKPKRFFKTVYFGVHADRELVYARINQRVDQMVKNGLVEEAKKLYPYKSLNALQTVGYRELFEHFEGKTTLDTAIEEIKKNTRRFAKRQLTWYRKNENITWVSHHASDTEVIAQVENRIKSIADG